jgi:hypothetical protein
MPVLRANGLATGTPGVPVGPEFPDWATGAAVDDDTAAPVSPVFVELAWVAAFPLSPVVAFGWRVRVEVPPAPPVDWPVAMLAPPPLVAAPTTAPPMLAAGPPPPVAAWAAPPVPPLPPAENASVTFVAAPVVPDSAVAVDAEPEFALLRETATLSDAPVSPLGAAVVGGVAWAGVLEGIVAGVEVGVGAVVWATAVAPPRNTIRAARMTPSDAFA